jgi:hypothetical protein
MCVITKKYETAEKLTVRLNIGNSLDIFQFSKKD